MVKTSTEREVDQEGSLREGLEAAIRERVQEIISDGNPGLAGHWIGCGSAWRTSAARCTSYAT